jgi:hypothetical protein
LTTCHYFGGPAHLDEMEVETPKTVHSIVVSANEERAQTDRQLMEELGIPPPFGTYIAHYLLIAEWMGDRLYVFVDQEGEIPDVEEEEDGGN